MAAFDRWDAEGNMRLLGECLRAPKFWHPDSRARGNTAIPGDEGDRRTRLLCRAMRQWVTLVRDDTTLSLAQRAERWQGMVAEAKRQAEETWQN
jgi:hypothetical protein